MSTRISPAPPHRVFCDGRTELKLSGAAQTAPVERAGWEHPVPDGWPCDAEGKLVESSGYEAL